LDEPAFIEFIDLAYESAADPALWPTALRKFATLTQASSAVLMQVSIDTGLGSGLLTDVDPESERLYNSHFATRNPLQTLYRNPAAKWTASVFRDEDVLPKAELRRTEYYNDFLRRFDLGAHIIFRLALIGRQSVSLNMLRPHQRDRFEEPQMQLAYAAHPHLMRAFTLGQRFAEARTMGEGLNDWAESSPHGLFLLDETGRILRTNAAGARALSANGGLRSVGGRLTAASPDAAVRLEALIAQAAEPVRRGGSMTLAAPGRSRPLWLTVTPGPRRPAALLSPKPVIIVCANDPDCASQPVERALRDLFGLTPAETRLTLALAEGLSLREISEAFGLSPHTLHRQLAHVFDKTETHRQADLIRLVLRATDFHLN
jgi:DNA-binding CsgD family transcriptional regulator/PAS domain-containing protein